MIDTQVWDLSVSLHFLVFWDLGGGESWDKEKCLKIPY